MLKSDNFYLVLTLILKAQSVSSPQIDIGVRRTVWICIYAVVAAVVTSVLLLDSCQSARVLQ